MHIALLLPFEMTVRHVVGTGLPERLLANPTITRISVICRREGALPTGCDYVPLLRPWRYDHARPLTLVRLLSDTRMVLAYGIHVQLTHRFNRINAFRGFSDRLKQSWSLRKREIAEGHPSSMWLGFPAARSRFMYRLLTTLYRWLTRYHHDAETWVREYKPQGLVVGHLQNMFVAPYIAAANRYGVPLLGLNGSWDQPTSKGPLAAYDGPLLAQNQHVREELIRLHHVAASRIHLCGWPQMDMHITPQCHESRSDFLRCIGLPKEARYILFGAYSERLGPHEPEVLEALAKQITQNTFGENTWLYVRCHPLDHAWEKRFTGLRAHPRVVLEPPSLDQLGHLTLLLRHANIVIASAGTIALDAVALDRPAIALAYEDVRLPYYDRPARRFDMEHYAKVIATGGICRVASTEALMEAIQRYLQAPHTHAKERETLRQEFLHPLDGKSTDRIAEHIMKAFTR